MRERVWHPSQEIQDHPDGSLTLTVRVTHLIEVKRWALSFGADCEALAPPELRAEIAAEVRGMMEKLEGPG